MSEAGAQTVIRLEAAQQAFRLGFMGWQCRLRQMAVRNGGGRPTSGMRPLLRLDDETAYGPVTVLISKQDSTEAIAEFRHMARKTHDPAERYKAAQRFLAAAYYQHPQDFSSRLTALFGPDSSLVERLTRDGACHLEFAQYNQHFTLPCSVERLATGDSLYQATYWHNCLYNARIPADAPVLAFLPDWSVAEAVPPVG